MSPVCGPIYATQPESILDVCRLGQNIKMAPVFVDGLMPWLEHFFMKACGRLYQLIFRSIAALLKGEAPTY